MILDEVAAVGVGVTLQADGWYAVKVWHRLQGGGRMHTTDYADLSWSEALDVMLAELHARRPGWALGGGWQQPPLF